MHETRANWTDLIAGVGLEIAEVFDQGQEEYLPGVGEVFSVTGGAGAQKNLTGKTGAGRLKKFDDGDDIPTGKRYKTYTTKVNYNNYGEAVMVTKNTIDDRDWSSELDEMKDLSVAANFSMDESAFQLLNGSFATTTLVNGYEMTWYGDGKAHFSTVHPTVVPGASTQSNASSTGIKLSHDNLETGKVALIEQKTDDGLPMALLGNVTLVVPPQMDKEAQEITQSVLQPNNANNAINVYKGNTNMVSSLFLGSANNGSDTRWFLTVVGRNKLVHEIRQAPALESDTNILNKIVTFTIDARWADYAKDWRRSWASKGDLATYSS